MTFVAACVAASVTVSPPTLRSLSESWRRYFLYSFLRLSFVRRGAFRAYTYGCPERVNITFSKISISVLAIARYKSWQLLKINQYRTGNEIMQRQKRAEKSSDVRSSASP